MSTHSYWWADNEFLWRSGMFGMYGIGAGQQRKMEMQGTSELLREIEAVETPLYVEPFQAFRAWFLVRHPRRGLMLRSVSQKVGWPHRKPMIAHCMTQLRGQMTGLSKHSAPNLKHHCGIYGVKEMHLARKWAGFITAPSAVNAQVVGSVNLWGHVMVFEHGFIGEYAYPHRLNVRRSSLKHLGYPAEEEVMAELRESYGVHVQMTEWEYGE